MDTVLNQAIWYTDERINYTRGELENRISAAERDFLYINERISDHATMDALNDLRYRFDELRQTVNDVLLKLQECARNMDLVDDEGGSLDEFIQTFVR